MALVTRPRIKAIYTMLRLLPPFCRWGLPEPDAIKFTICNGTHHGMYSVDEKDRINIEINPYTHITLFMLTMTIAHEMVHIRQDQLGQLPNSESKQHNKAFQRLARMVCKELGFEPTEF
jgi:hypothetical protein